MADNIQKGSKADSGGSHCVISISQMRTQAQRRHLLWSNNTPKIYNEKDIFLGCQFQKVLQVFTALFNFSFFSVTGWGIDLDYRDIEWFALEMNIDHSVIFEIASKYCISDSLLTMMATPQQRGLEKGKIFCLGVSAWGAHRYMDMLTNYILYSFVHIFFLDCPFYISSLKKYIVYKHI